MILGYGYLRKNSISYLHSFATMSTHAFLFLVWKKKEEKSGHAGELKTVSFSFLLKSYSIFSTVLDLRGQLGLFLSRGGLQHQKSKSVGLDSYNVGEKAYFLVF